MQPRYSIFLLLMEASGDRNVVIARDVGIEF